MARAAIVDPEAVAWTVEKGWRYLWVGEKCVAGHPEGKPEDSQFWNGKEWQLPDRIKGRFPGDGFAYFYTGRTVVMAWQKEDVWLKAGKRWVRP